MIDDDARKPLPVIVTLWPTIPELILSDRVGAVTVKVALAVLPDESVATTRCAPAGELGTLNEQFKAPEIPITHVEGEVGWAAPLNAIVTDADAG